MRVAITGASGFLGRHVVSRLLVAGHQVRALVRRQPAGLPCRTVIADIDEIEQNPDQYLNGCEAVVNCAGLAHQVGPQSDGDLEQRLLEANRDYPARLAQAALTAECTRFVHVSSVAAICSVTPPGSVVTDYDSPRPSTPYGRSKLAGDLEVLGLSSDAMPIAVLRPPVLYGADPPGWFALFLRAARLGLPMPVGSIENLRSLCFVSNFADAIEAAIRSRVAGSYIVTDSEPVSTAQIYRDLLEAFDRPDRVWYWPASVVEFAAQAILRGRAQSFIGSAAFDGSRFTSEFHWYPEVSRQEAFGQISYSVAE